MGLDYSVIIITYNYGQYIAEAIESVLNQNLNSFKYEIIIVDDGSTDDTQEVVAKFGNSVSYFFQENSGKASATKLAISHCSGEIVFNLDADDYFHPTKIKEVMDIFIHYPCVMHVGHPAIYKREYDGCWSKENIPEGLLGRVINGRELLKNFYLNNYFFGGGSTFAARSTLLKNCRISNEIDMYIDEFLALNVMLNSDSFLIPKALSTWRIHTRNFSDKTNSQYQKNKYLRLLRSSEHLHNFLLNINGDDIIFELYDLKLLSNKIYFQELFSSNKWSYIKELIIKLLHSKRLTLKEKVRFFAKYKLIRRFLPAFLITLAKRMKSLVSKRLSFGQL
jgi:glycosyltransferase involved in cell wall biosynthesis